MSLVAELLKLQNYLPHNGIQMLTIVSINGAWACVAVFPDTVGSLPSGIF